jgi:glucuronate isomerase
MPPAHWPRLTLAEDRFFGPDPRQKEIAGGLLASVAGLPLLCPHGHVDPRLFADPAWRFSDPATLFITPDHYVYRMLYSQGVTMESLGVPRRDSCPVESDPRRIWQTFADNFYLFRGTPVALWFNHSLVTLFGVEHRLTGESAQYVYDQIASALPSAGFSPRAIYGRFNIEVLSTTDAATDPLTQHQAIAASGWQGRVVPTFRPDGVQNLDAPGWRANIDALGAAWGREITSFQLLLRALQDRRAFFKTVGAFATDHAAVSAFTVELTPAGADAIFQRALRGAVTTDEIAQFNGHMLMESARMSLEDGLVMQLHVGAFRNHNAGSLERFGPDTGADIPVACEFTRSLRPLLNKYGVDPRLALIVFTLDDATYTRELAPLAGHYPAMKLGAAWWFHDSLSGMTRHRERLVEICGLYNTAGFVDDTRSLPSIAARHDMARRVDANWLAGLVARGILDQDEALAIMRDAAYGLAKRAYRIP